MTGQVRGEGLARRERLRRRPEFVTVQDRGRRVPGKDFVLLSLPRAGGGATPARLGVTVSKKVGKAVVRNRVKRWVRECYRRSKTIAPPGLDLVVVARPSAATGDYERVAQEIGALLRRLRGR